ncbi:MAG: DUF1330 domain-containing protein [Myxococcota bacterium]
MSSFVLVRTTVHDDDAFEAYRTLAAPSIRAFAGKMLLRGSVLEVMEGDESSERVAVIAFKDADTARAWYRSPEYQHAIAARTGAATMALTLVDGH